MMKKTGLLITGCLATLCGAAELNSQEGDNPAYVAQIQNQSYETMDAAWKAASGTATITLLADATLDPDYKIVFSAQDITIDLNGHKLDATSAESEDAIFGLRSGKLTVKNGELTVGTLIGGGNAEIVVENTTVNGNMDPNGGKLTLVSGDFSGATLTAQESATVTKTAGLAVTAPADYYWKDDTTLTVGSPEPAYAARIGETKYETMDAAMSSAFASASDVTVTVLSDGDYTLDPMQNFFNMGMTQKTVTLDLNGANVTMKSDMMILYGNKLVVTGDGTMTFENGGKLRAMMTSNGEVGDKAAIVIESGTFVNNTGTYVIIADDYGSLTVNGGTFSAAADVPVIAVAKSSSHVELNGGTYPAGALSVKTKTPDVTKTASLAVTAPEGYYWKDDTTLTVKDVVQPEVSVTGASGGNATMVTEDGGLPEVGFVVTLKATPDEGYTFAGWSGDMVSLDAETSMTIPEKEKVEVAANFLPTEVFAALTNQAVTTYVKDNNLVSMDSIRELSAQNPTITVEKDENNNPIADVGIQLMRTSTLSGKDRSGTPNWTPVTKADFIDAFYDEASSSFRFRIPADANAQFFRFVPVNVLSATPEN